MHPGFGLRDDDDPASTDWRGVAYREFAAQGLNWDDQIRAYSRMAGVWPWSTWLDARDPYEPATRDSDEAPWRKLAKIARRYGRGSQLWGENTAAADADDDEIFNASVFLHDFDRHAAINLRAPLLIAQALARQLPEDEVGLIVNLVDQKLFNLNPDFLTYTLSKMGLHGLTHVLAQALAPRLRVMGIAPGLTLQGLHQTPARFAERSPPSVSSA